MTDRRLLIPLIAAVLLAVASIWRMRANKPQDYADQVAAAVMMRPAPTFEALDSNNHLVRLNSLLGRHKIIVVFFDGESGADQDAGVLRLRQRFGELQSHGVKVIAVSAAIPQQNRAAISRVGAFPFPLVSDIDPRSPEGNLRIHREWGRINSAGQPRTGVFLIDRKGQLPVTPDGPRPLASVELAIDESLR